MTFRLRALAYSVGIPGILLGLLPWVILRFHESQEFPLGPFFSILGGTLILSGATVIFSGASYLTRRGDGTPFPFAPPKRMVVSGPYAHIQHPMLAGLLLMLLGEASWFQSLSLGLYTGVAFGFAHLFVIFREEPGLKERFGEDYHAYQAATPRWFPV